jgi:subtilisin family serine protease
MAEGKLMRKSKFGLLSMFVCGLGAVLLLAFPVTAQDKGRFVPWEHPKDWETLKPEVDYIPNTFVIGFNKPKIAPERLKGIVDLIQRVGEGRKLQIENVSDQYFRGLENSTMPPARVQVVRPEPKATAAASVVGDTSIPNPNVCSNLVQYFRVSDATGPALANLIDDLNAAIGTQFPDDVYILEPNTGGHPIQAPTPDWAKPAIATSAEPVTASGVTVAVLDSGYTAAPGYTPAHSWNAVFRLPDNSPNMKFTSTQLADNADNLSTPHTRGHGTGVASIIRGPDLIGGEPNTISLTSDAEIYPIKVCEDETCSSVSIAIGICRAVSGIDGPVNVINLSLAGAVKSWLIDGAIKDAVAANVTVVAAAGNIKTDKVEASRWNETPGHYFFDYPLYPAALSKSVEGLISVGAAQQALGGFEWAVFNPKSPRWQLEEDQPRTVTNLHDTIDLMAPGKYVLALPNDDKAPLTNVVGGTSFATPFVSAAAAILLGQNSSLTPKQIEGLLVDAARSHPVDCPPGMCGAGMLNIQGSLDLLDNPAYLSANGITP